MTFRGLTMCIPLGVVARPRCAYANGVSLGQFLKSRSVATRVAQNEECETLLEKTENRCYQSAEGADRTYVTMRKRAAQKRCAASSWARRIHGFRSLSRHF